MRVTNVTDAVDVLDLLRGNYETPRQNSDGTYRWRKYRRLSADQLVAKANDIVRYETERSPWFRHVCANAAIALER